MKKIWMPLYVDDFLSATTQLNAAEVGAYMLLIMHYWRKGGLPSDEKQIARIARCTGRQWPAVRAVVAPLFDIDGSGAWKHRRVDAELLKAGEISNKRRGAALQMHLQMHLQKGVQTGVQKPIQLQSQSQAQKKDRKEGSAPAAPRARRSSGERLPRDWQVSTRGHNYAKRRGLSDREIGFEAEKFAKHYWALPSSRPTSHSDDWESVWDSWVLRTAERLGRQERAQEKSSDPRTYTEGQWASILKIYRMNHNWNLLYGPEPGQPGCLVPVSMLVEAV